VGAVVSTIAPKWQYSYHAMNPSMPKEWLTYISTMYFPDLDFQEKSSVIETPDSSPSS
jgi:hypothetical protein